MFLLDIDSLVGGRYYSVSFFPLPFFQISSLVRILYAGVVVVESSWALGVPCG